MSTIRELVFFAIEHGDLHQSSFEETGVDHIGALARSDPLGACLWRITASHDVGAFREAIVLLANALHSDRRRALLAIEEWLQNVPATDVYARKMLVSADARVGRQIGFQLGRKHLKRKAIA